MCLLTARGRRMHLPPQRGDNTAMRPLAKLLRALVYQRTMQTNLYKGYCHPVMTVNKRCHKIMELHTKNPDYINESLVVGWRHLVNASGVNAGWFVPFVDKTCGWQVKLCDPYNTCHS